MALLENAILWAAGLDGTVAGEPAAGPVREAATMDAPHPNPFRGATTFAYELAAPAAVSLTVYDALGRRVAVVVEGEQAAGRHQVEWAPAGLTPGVYLSVLRVDGHMVTRRVLRTR
jgi:hypothetical protein